MLISILKKNLRRAYYERALIVYDLMNVAFNSAIFLGISRFLNPDNAQSYALFVIPALGARELMMAAVSTPRAFIDNEVQIGTLEHLSTSTPSLLKILALESAWPLFKGLFKVILYLAAATLLLSNRIEPQIDPMALLVGFVLVSAQFWALGLISAGYGLISRRGHFINEVIVLSATLLGGTYFSTSILPQWLHKPVNWSALEAFNQALRGKADWDVIGISAVATVPIIVIGIKAFELCLRRARQRGTLVL